MKEETQQVLRERLQTVTQQIVVASFESEEVNMRTKLGTFTAEQVQTMTKNMELSAMTLQAVSQLFAELGLDYDDTQRIVSNAIITTQEDIPTKY